MDLREISQEMIVKERNHWWIKTRFIHLDRAIEWLKNHSNSSKSLKIVEFGCGSAQNLWYLDTQSKFLNNFETLVGVDPNLPDNSLPSWNVNPLGGAKRVVLTKINPDPSTQFDLIVAMDVLEHIEDHKNVLISWANSIPKGGHIFLTVPAFQFLWSGHDEFLGHVRRYTKKELDQVVIEAGFEKVYSNYIFWFAFPIVYLLRVFLRPKKVESDLKEELPLINFILILLGKMESCFNGNPFFGTSVMGLYRKK